MKHLMETSKPMKVDFEKVQEVVSQPKIYKAVRRKLAFFHVIDLHDEEGKVFKTSKEHHPEGGVIIEHEGVIYYSPGSSTDVYFKFKDFHN